MKSACGLFMKKNQKVSTAGDRYRIECVYAPEVLVPSEAIERSFYEKALPWTEDLFITMDGKICRPEFLISWGEIDEAIMDGFCEDRWGMSFRLVRSLWIDRLKLRFGLKSWHYIRLHEQG